MHGSLVSFPCPLPCPTYALFMSPWMQGHVVLVPFQGHYSRLSLYTPLMPSHRCPLGHLCAPLGHCSLHTPFMSPCSPLTRLLAPHCAPLRSRCLLPHVPWHIPLHAPILSPCVSPPTPCPLLSAPSRGCLCPPPSPMLPQMQEVQELARGARSRAEESLGRSQAARSRAEKATAQLRDFIRRIKAFLAGNASTGWAQGHGEAQHAHPEATPLPCPHRGGCRPGQHRAGGPAGAEHLPAQQPRPDPGAAAGDAGEHWPTGGSGRGAQQHGAGAGRGTGAAGTGTGCQASYGGYACSAGQGVGVHPPGLAGAGAVCAIAGSEQRA